MPRCPVTGNVQPLRQLGCLAFSLRFSNSFSKWKIELPIKMCMGCAKIIGMWMVFWMRKSFANHYIWFRGVNNLHIWCRSLIFQRDFLLRRLRFLISCNRDFQRFLIVRSIQDFTNDVIYRSDQRLCISHKKYSNCRLDLSFCATLHDNKAAINFFHKKQLISRLGLFYFGF